MALARITGLWAKEGKKGTFYTGNTREEIPANVGIMLFENDEKESDNDPDYTLCFTDDDGEDDKPPAASKPKRSFNKSRSNGSSQRSGGRNYSRNRG